jgi:hypothetical protein
LLLLHLLQQRRLLLLLLLLLLLGVRLRGDCGRAAHVTIMPAGGGLWSCRGAWTCMGPPGAALQRWCTAAVRQWLLLLLLLLLLVLLLLLLRTTRCCSRLHPAMHAVLVRSHLLLLLCPLPCGLLLRLHRLPAGAARLHGLQQLGLALQQLLHLLVQPAGLRFGGTRRTHQHGYAGVEGAATSAADSGVPSGDAPLLVALQALDCAQQLALAGGGSLAVRGICVWWCSCPLLLRARVGSRR